MSVGLSWLSGVLLASALHTGCSNVASRPDSAKPILEPNAGRSLMT
jgi:hypothetical protein